MRLPKTIKKHLQKNKRHLKVIKRHLKIVKKQLLPNPAEKIPQLIRTKTKSYTRNRRIKRHVPQNKSKTVILGPWLGEVGPEIQYWIPYLQKLKSTGYFRMHKLIALSRGGVQNWYKNLTDQYFEVFDYITTEELHHIQNDVPGFGEKQIRWKDGERSLIRKIAAQERLTDYVVFHPSDMWFDVLGWTKERVTFEQITSFLEFKKFPNESLYQDYVDQLCLPPRFIVAKFYHNSMFPLTEDNQRLANEIINVLSRRQPVVMLGNPFQMGDHSPFQPTLESSVMVISEELKLQTNLGVQTEILRRSDGLFSTYGGLSVLPAFIGKSAVSFYSTNLNRSYAKIHFQHETITVRLYHEMSAGSYTLLHADGWKNLKTLLKLDSGVP